MKVRYSSNNSGGSWWVKDAGWEALEKAGWTVYWTKDNDKHGKFTLSGIGDMKPHCLIREDGRYLGALAKEADIEVETPGDAMRAFEKATGLDVSDEGCNCCGAPHTFYWGRAIDGQEGEYGSARGEGCLEHLFPGRKIPKSKREMIEGSRE